MDCDQTAMGLPPVTSAVLFIAKQFGKTSLRNIWDASTTPSAMKREWYDVCIKWCDVYEVQFNVGTLISTLYTS
jgi:hypothetical protein